MSVVGNFSAFLGGIWANYVEALHINPGFTVFSTCVVLHVSYYIRYVVNKPEILVERNGVFHRFLTKYCPVVNESFYPTIWCYGARAQTIVRSVLHTLTCPTIHYRRELLPTDDGGLISLDWCEGTDCGKQSAIVLILPGITGCSKAEYARFFCRDMNLSKRRAVVLNYRGMGGVELKTPRTYCSTNTEDLSFALHHIRKLNPDSPIMAIGISLGGMMLTHYLCDRTDESILCAGMAISPPWESMSTANSLEEPINWLLFNRLLTQLLNQQVARNSEIFTSGGHDVQKVVRSRTIREFDGAFTVKVFGYKDIGEYYSLASIADKVTAIRVPMLYLNAADDVFAPRCSINEHLLYTSGNVACVLTQHGGHIGFLDGILVPSSDTMMNRLVRQYVDAIFRHGDELEQITC